MSKEVTYANKRLGFDLHERALSQAGHRAVGLQPSLTPTRESFLIHIKHRPHGLYDFNEFTLKYAH